MYYFRIRILLLLAGVMVHFGLMAQQWERFTAPARTSMLTPDIIQLGDTLLIHNDHALNDWNAVSRSLDGGKTWAQMTPAYPGDQAKILVLNPHNNWIYATSWNDTIGNTVMKVSKNYGATWQGAYPIADRHIMFKGDSVFYLTIVAGESKLGLIKPDGSVVDDYGDLPTLSGYYQCYGMAADGEHLWIVDKQVLYHSANGGLTWEPINFALPDLPTWDQYIPQIFALNGEVLITDVRNNTLYFSNDYGVSWDTLVQPATIISERKGRLYRIDRTNNMIMRFEGGAIDNWSEITAVPGYLNAAVSDYLNPSFHFGILIGEERIGVATYDYGFSYKNKNEANWYPVHGELPGWYDGLTPVTTARGKLFGGINYALVSNDNGDTWQCPDASWAGLSEAPVIWEISDSLFTWREKKVSVCADNGRYEWVIYQTLPVEPYSVAVSGDTMIMRNNINTYRSFNRFQTWEIAGNATGKERFQSSKGKFYMIRDSALYITSDVGTTWNKVFQFQHKVDFSNSQFYCIRDTFFISYAPLDLIYRSGDGGQTFDSLPSPVNPSDFVFRFRHNEGRLYLLNNSGLIHFSLDMGQSWQSFSPPTPLPPTQSDPNLPTITITSNTIFAEGWRARLDGNRQVSGRVFYDLNGNGQYNSIEPGANDVVVKAHQQSTLQVTYADGNFSFLFPPVTDTLSVPDVPKHYTVSPALKVSQPANNQPVLFALKPSAAVDDVAAEMNITTPFKAGFENTLLLQAKNVGTQKATGALKFAFNGPLNVLQFDPQPDAMSGDTALWYFTDLKPARLLKVKATVAAAVVPPGTPYLLWAATQNNAGDVDESDNTKTLQGEVLASYDPNDKSVSTDEIPLSDLETAELEYTIRFQNLGNAPTDFIVVRDTLSAALDPASVKLLAFSHPCTWRIEEGHILVFTFSPIMLSAAVTDEVNSHGFVKFAVRLADHLSPGDVIANTAHIYFDFNPAIVTNTVTSQVQTVSVSFVPLQTGQQLLATPNPSADIVRLSLLSQTEVEKESQLNIFDTQGKMQWAQSVTGNTAAVAVSSWPAGVYWCRWQTGKSSAWCKIVVSK